MRKTVTVFLWGFAAGILVAYLFTWTLGSRGTKRIAAQDPGVCYSCLWGDAAFRADAVQFYRQYKTSDPLAAADVLYILWRANSNPNCDVLDAYRGIASKEKNAARRLMAEAIVAFGGPECGRDESREMGNAADSAKELGRAWEASAFQQLKSGKFEPQFGDAAIAVSLDVPPGAKTMILGESKIELTPNLRVGAQVDRVARDWASYQVKWDHTDKPLPAESLLWYHEGAVVKNILKLAPVEVYPLSGTITAKHGDKWYGPDETGTFRFEVLGDKIEYPTTHVSGGVGWIEDTHGISALVSQALERKMQVVVGCGDSDGKAKAAYYLAEKGVSVVFPGDRYQEQLIGYQAKGVLLGTAPVKNVGGKPVIGDQPIRFSLREAIVVEDTKQNFPIQYYDSGARYFRRLSSFVPLNVTYVNIDEPNQIDRVLKRATELKANAVGVRVATKEEDLMLRVWLAKAPNRRAILFHSGLYPFAQQLFEDYPSQVTFGDLHPRFE